MTGRRIGIGIAIGAGLGVAAGGEVRAEPITSGSIRGVVRGDDGAPLAGAAVIATSGALQGAAATVADPSGRYELVGLPPGVYDLIADQAGNQAFRSGVEVRLGKVVAIDLEIADADAGTGAGEIIAIQGRPPTLDLGSAKLGVTLDPRYLTSVPTGRRFTDVAEAAPGAQVDDHGVSFYGSTSPENAYLIDGVNVTGIGFGDVTSSLPNEFLGEVEVISGGYGAELGRATGGIVNVLTRAGSNEFHGSVFGYLTPGGLTADRRDLPREGTALRFDRELGYAAEGGFELGGPILRDRLWFHVGFAPAIERQDVARVISRQLDVDRDGVPDIDDRGFRRSEEVDRRDLALPSRTYAFTSKLSYAASDAHRGSLAVFGNPSRRDLVVDEFAVGPDESMRVDRKSGAIDAVGRWTSDLGAPFGRVEAGLGLQREQDRARPEFEAGNDPAFRWVYERSLADFGSYEDVPAACVDGGAGDPTPDIVNCPVVNYQVGGVDLRTSEERQRLAGRLAYRQVVQAGGRHELAIGLDLEDARMESTKRFSGGARWWDFDDGAIYRFGFATPSAEGAPCGGDFDGDLAPDGRCTGLPSLTTDTRTSNVAGFLQDSWSPLPELVINAGLRWERQALHAADHVAGQIDPFTGDPIDETPLVLGDLFAPRLGAVYDWTREGRSRVFGHWGRYYESIPLDLNSRGLGGEVVDIQVYDRTTCGDSLDPASYGCDAAGYLGGLQLGGNRLVAPGLDGQHSDEWVAGVEVEVLEGLTVGASFIRRVLKGVIEDVSPFVDTNGDGVSEGASVLANPGEVDEDAVADLRAAAAVAGDPITANRLDYQADLLEGVGAFPKAVRHYNALELTAAHRPTDRVLVRGSYTLSLLRGNYPGLYSPDTGQLDPNFTSMYDFADAMENRFGDLPHDRRHRLKLDGFYRLDLGRAAGTFVFGGRWRGASGRPGNYLGTHLASQGVGEIYILPRGSGERTPFQSATDVKVAYGRSLGDGMALEVFVDVFNLFNQQTTTRRDEIYTYNAVAPIPDGTTDDLAGLQAIDPTTGMPAGPATVNPNYGKAIETQDPLSVRLGARLSF